MVPVVTSQHRHYIRYMPDSEENLKKILEWLRSKGYSVVEGMIELNRF